MMKFYLINGSPRNNFNTVKLLDKVREGINSKISDNVEIEQIDLYKLNYTGCRECFMCKMINGPFFAKCPVKDDLNPLLEKLWDADGIIIGSPIFFGDLTGEVRSFMERLLFPKFPYAEGTEADKRMPIGLVVSMNLNRENGGEIYDTQVIHPVETFFEKVFTKPHTVVAYDTYQFTNYSLYKMEDFNEEDKAKVRDEQLPKDLENAYNLGVTIAKEAKEL